MTIHEPMTFATDLILSVATCGFGVRLWRKHGGRALRLWAAGFVASACGALAGGLYHALGPEGGELLRFCLWKGTVYAIGLAGLLLVLGAGEAVLGRRGQYWLLRVALLKFGVYAVWMAQHDAFVYVIYDYAPALVAVLVLQGVSYWQERAPAARWIAAGVLLSFVAAAIQALRIAPHPNFNHNDLYHVVQLLAFWFLYQGGLRLRDPGAAV